MLASAVLASAESASLVASAALTETGAKGDTKITENVAVAAAARRRRGWDTFVIENFCGNPEAVHKPKQNRHELSSKSAKIARLPAASIT